MKFFKGKEVPRREVVLGHCYQDDLLDAAEAELVEGKLEAAVTVLAEARGDAESRDLRLEVLSPHLVGSADQIAELAVRHSVPELMLLAGETYIEGTYQRMVGLFWRKDVAGDL